MHRVLFINPFGIGDCLFTTPLISAIKSSWPDSFVGFWCNERVAELLKPNPKIDLVWGLSRGDLKRKYGNFSPVALAHLLKLYGQIKKSKFDIALDFSLDHRYGLLAKLAVITERIGFNYKGRGRFLTKKIEISGYNDRHIVEYYLQLLEFLGVKAPKARLELYVDKSAANWANIFLAEKNITSDTDLIGISPGEWESRGKDAYLKRWEAEKFAQVADAIFKDFKARVLLFGNLADKDICDKVYENITDKSKVYKIYPQFTPLENTTSDKEIVINRKDNNASDSGDKLGRGLKPASGFLTGFTLSQFSALLTHCKLLLTNDGGPLHMAAALGLKTVSIFGPVSDLVYGPYPGEREHVVIKTDYQCRPCYKNFRLEDCHNQRKCLSDIDPGQVYQAIKNIL